MTMDQKTDQKTKNALIESYAMIGDCETAALVGIDGSIDWLCWPSFSSDACFARLLGSEENGRWLIAPAGKVKKTSRKYRDHTLILETTFETEEGIATLIDFMPVRETNSDLVRIVKGVRGSVPIKMELVLRFGYGLIVPWATCEQGSWKAIAGPDLVVLRTQMPLEGVDLTTVSEFTIKAGESASFAMTYSPSHLLVPRPIDVDEALGRTQTYWEKWAARCPYDGPYRQAVERSLITLKALTYHPTGGIVAAVTTSLPEQLGGQRNWDYRYCWLRDATFTLLAFMNGGYYQEARRWHAWLLRAIAGSAEQAQIMYGIAGQRHLLEWEIPWLDGYEGSKPVRVGNAAAGQLQLDIYGELMDAFFHAFDRLDESRELDFHMLRSLMDRLGQLWEKPDQGIWETRGSPQHFTYSKVMAWVAFDRAIRVAEKTRATAPIEQWKKVRSKIHAEVCARAYNPTLGSFVQAYDSDQLDASLLLMPLVGFLPHDDERVRGTIDAIEKNLMPDGLVMRYNTVKVDDGLPPGEGVFLACSFWMVSNLTLMGRVEEANKLFERVLSLANDVGLLSEEYDIGRGRLVGNFPQAFSHISLATAAFDLANGKGRGSSHQRAHRSPGHSPSKSGAHDKERDAYV
jgi:GH15 family glucan-1,4-alpha-glucosidase